MDILCQSLSACVDVIEVESAAVKPCEAEVLWCSSPRHRNLTPTQPLSIGNTSVLLVSGVRDLEVYVDSTSP